MIGGLLRRLLEPLAITTAPAPVLAGGHVDVTADAVSIAVPTEPARQWTYVEFSTEVPVAVATEARLDYVDEQPAIDRGVCCYHHLHIDYDGRRFGALIHEHQRSASLLPCPYVGKDGR